MGAALTAHVMGWLQATAKCRPFRAAEDQAALLIIQLHAAHTSRLAIGHTGNRAGNGGRGATGAASWPALRRGDREVHGRDYTCGPVAGRAGAGADGRAVQRIDDSCR